MSFLFRTLKVLIFAYFGKRRNWQEFSRISFLVWPNDLDINVHMNNGRYASLMDLGRFDWLIRSGLLPIVIKNKWRPVVGSLKLRFRRGLEPFERFEIETRYLGWDDKWFYFEQRFIAKGRVACVGVIKGLFKSPKGNVSPDEVMSAMGFQESRPVLPPNIQKWGESEALWVVEK